jgi:ADP-dependent phosphofructokinase/glucokinase
VERPKVKTCTEPRVLNLNEIMKLIEGAPRSIKEFLSFVAYTGCRMKEGRASWRGEGCCANC